MSKILIIRLSSLGDIIQCLPAADLIKQQWPTSKTHWLVKKEFSKTLESSVNIDELIVYNKKLGLLSFIKTCWKLRQGNYTHIFDAHSNVRSHIASFILRIKLKQPYFLRRPKNRLKRWLLFSVGWNTLPMPFRGAKSFTSPLKTWGVKSKPWPKPGLRLSVNNKLSNLIKKDNFILLAPSAAWEMKRWPKENWINLVSKNPDSFFVIAGGPEDIFCEEIVNANMNNSINLAGKISWDETFELVNMSTLIISGDTGVLHMADYLQKNVICLIGPTAFGYPSSNNSIVLEAPLKCRPCTKDGRGKCKNSTYKECLTLLTPELVTQKMNEILNG